MLLRMLWNSHRHCSLLQVKSVHWLDDAEKRRFDSLLQNEVKEFRDQLREEESGTQSNLKQMKESLRQEAAKILQERADLHVQRQELV